MTELPALRYGPKDEFFYKESGQWYQKSKFFDTFLKKPIDQVPQEYVEAEAKREKQSFSFGHSSKNSDLLISFVNKEDEAMKKNCYKEDEKLAKKNSKIQSRIEAQKKIMILCEEDVARPEKVKTNRKLSSKARLAVFDKRSKNRSRYFAEVVKKSTECEESLETKQLLHSSNKKRVVRGKIAYCTTANKVLSLPETDFFHIEDLMDFAASKNVTVINSYQFLTVNTSRSAYFDSNGSCLYCAEHNNTLASHSPQSQCPHINCICVRCYALDLIKPDDV